MMIALGKTTGLLWAPVKISMRSHRDPQIDARNSPLTLHIPNATTLLYIGRFVGSSGQPKSVSIFAV